METCASDAPVGCGVDISEEAGGLNVVFCDAGQRSFALCWALGDQGGLFNPFMVMGLIMFFIIIIIIRSVSRLSKLCCSR